MANVLSCGQHKFYHTMRYEIWFGKYGHHVTETVEQGNRVSSLQESRRPYTMLKENHKETEYFEFKIYPL